VAQVVVKEVYVIISVPIACPVTTPPGVTVATTPGDVLNEPGTVASVKVTEVPIHNIDGPVGGAGGAKTDISVHALHPYGDIRMIVSTPAVTPVTTPLNDPIVATPGKLELHVPGSTSDTTATWPTQTLLGPVIACGVGSTVTTNIEEQPLAVYVYNTVSTPGLREASVPEEPGK